MNNDPPRPKVFDVGKPQAGPTSKPVIVGHHPTMPDPMMHRPLPTAQPSASPTALEPAKSELSTPLPSVLPVQAPAAPVTQPAPQVAAAPSPTTPSIRPIAASAPASAPKDPVVQPHTAKTIAVSEAVQKEIMNATKPISAEVISAEIAPASAVPSATADVNKAFNVQAVEIAPNLPSLPVSHGSPDAGVKMKFMLIWLCVLAAVVAVGIFLAIHYGIIKTSS